METWRSMGQNKKSVEMSKLTKMKKVLNKIISLDLYLNYPAKTIIETKCVEDVASGIYPVYYMKFKNHLKISSCAIALIKDSGEFILNFDFKPDFTQKDWYEERNTIDKRVCKLKSFEVRTRNSSKINFNPTRKLKDKDEFINKSIAYFKKFVNEIERKFPEYHHIVLTGGKDSQIIHLVPKLNEKKWNVLSEEPNATLVKKWLAANNIIIDHFFRIENKSDEDESFLMKKIVNGDCMSNPEHIRRGKTMIKISNFFNKKCIFWVGTLGDTIYNCHIEDYRKNNYEDYFKTHFNRGSSWQGNFHQTHFNLTGCPVLSLYHSKEIWEKLYQNFDPSISENLDLRKELGSKLAKRNIKWLVQNPGPNPWFISHRLKKDLLKIYIDKVNSLVKKISPSHTS